jgi:PiT family inorganic phosphate transporter
MLDQLHLTVYAIIGLALAFDYINGFHDAANSIATVVSTRVLSPNAAVAWAAFFNFVAFLVFPLGVAKTIGKGVVDHTQVTIAVVAAGLIGAIIWNLITWWYGIPSSSSHALVGGLVGAAVMKCGWQVLVKGGLVVELFTKGVWNAKKVTLIDISVFIFVAPIVGLILGFALMLITYWLFRHASPARVTGIFRKLQFISASAYSLGHGGNDAQKTMGIIFVVLIAAGFVPKEAEKPDLWVVLVCHAAMGLGTLAGGWRIVRTMGQKICQLQPVHGFCAETAGALALFGATIFKIPVSTTHTITGSIVGVGSTRGLHAVKWGVAGRVVWAWVLTIPVTAGIAAALYYPMSWVIKF